MLPSSPRRLPWMLACGITGLTAFGPLALAQESAAEGQVPVAEVAADAAEAEKALDDATSAPPEAGEAAQGGEAAPAAETAAADASSASSDSPAPEEAPAVDGNAAAADQAAMAAGEAAPAPAAESAASAQDDRWMVEYRARRKAAAAARWSRDAWASLVRMEVGLGWGVAGSSNEDLFGADKTIRSYGPEAFLGVKFRLSPRIPLQLGIDASYSHHFLVDDNGVKSIAEYDAISVVMGNVTLTAFPNRRFYLMLGLGAGGLGRDLDVKSAYARWDDDWDVGATGLVAAGVLFDVAEPFRVGLEVRAAGGIFDRDACGMFSGHLVLSFF